MIIFVGDKASKKNINENVAFVGTKSYKKLLNWICQIGISINEIIICNQDDIKTYGISNNFHAVETKLLLGESYHCDILESDKIITLGRKAEKKLKELNLDYFYLPHPSGSNPRANESEELKKLLTSCKEYIYGR